MALISTCMYYLPIFNSINAVRLKSESPSRLIVNDICADVPVDLFRFDPHPDVVTEATHALLRTHWASLAFASNASIVLGPHGRSTG